MTKHILIQNLEKVDSKTKNILIEAGYETIGDLVSKEVYDISFLLTEGTFNHFCDTIHYDYEMLFKGEYNPREVVNEEVEKKKLTDVALPTSIKFALMRGGITTLGQLLVTDYQEIKRIRNMGVRHLTILKEYVHSLGYTLRSESTTIEEKKEILKSQGVKLIEEYFNDPLLMLTFYKNNIFTLEDLINFGPGIYHLGGIGNKRKQLIAKRLKELNISFGEEDYIIPSQEENDLIKNENEDLTTNIKKKKILLKEYYDLLKENKELKLRESELDELLNQIEDVLNNGRK